MSSAYLRLLIFLPAILIPATRYKTCNYGEKCVRCLKTCICHAFYSLWGFPGGSEVKVSACNAGDLGSIPPLGRYLEKEMATHSSILAWRIPWTEEPDGLHIVHRVAKNQTWLSDFTFTFTLLSALFKLTTFLLLNIIHHKSKRKFYGSYFFSIYFY